MHRISAIISPSPSTVSRKPEYMDPPGRRTAATFMLMLSYPILAISRTWSRHSFGVPATGNRSIRIVHQSDLAIAQLLLVGAILAAGLRTVAAALRVMGRSDQDDYARYHEVLNRAVWASRGVARVLLVLLLQHLDRGDGPLIFGIRSFDQSGNPGTASRRQDQGSGHLSRRGAFQPPPTGQGQWVALDLPDVAGPRAVGGTPLGAVGAHRAGTLGPVLSAVTYDARAHSRLHEWTAWSIIDRRTAAGAFPRAGGGE